MQYGYVYKIRKNEVSSTCSMNGKINNICKIFEFWSENHTGTKYAQGTSIEDNINLIVVPGMWSQFN
jgi:hypothetical protein